MKQLTILTLSILLAACGGGGESSPAECMPAEQFAALVSDGSIRPRPPLGPRDFWAEPFVVSIPIGWPGAPVLWTGPYYVPGEVPAYVCP